MADTGTPVRTRRPIEETADLGRALYRGGILQQLKADHFGEVVAIDVDSELWAVGEDEGEAVERLRELRPDAVNILCERVGYTTLRSFGGSLRRIE